MAESNTYPGSGCNAQRSISSISPTEALFPRIWCFRYFSHFSRNFWFSSAISLALGIGTQTLRRIYPTRPSTSPFSLPEAGLQKGLIYFDFAVRREHRSVEVFVITNAMTHSQRQEKFTLAAEYPKPCHHPKGRLHHWCWYWVCCYPWQRRP